MIPRNQPSASHSFEYCNLNLVCELTGTNHVREAGLLIRRMLTSLDQRQQLAESLTVTGANVGHRYPPHADSRYCQRRVTFTILRLTLGMLRPVNLNDNWPARGVSKKKVDTAIRSERGGRCK